MAYKNALRLVTAGLFDGRLQEWLPRIEFLYSSALDFPLEIGMVVANS